MRFCPNGCRPIDDIVDTLETSIKGRVTEPASFLLHYSSMYSATKGTNTQPCPCSWLQITKVKKCFPLLPLDHLFLPQFFFPWNLKKVQEIV